MRKTSVYLPERLKDALAARAAATGRSEAEVIRAALEAEVWADPPGEVRGRPADSGVGGATGRRPEATGRRPEATVAGRPVGIGAGPEATVPGRFVGIGAGPEATVPGRFVGIGAGPEATVAGRPVGIGAGPEATVAGRPVGIGAGPEATVAGRPVGIGAGPEATVPGRFVGIGVGPGDADLVTVRAVAALRRADRIVAPATAIDAVGRAEAIVRQAVPGLRVERIPFAMAPGRAERDRSVEEAATVLAAYLAAGEEVAFVTLGDPLMYSTFTSVAAAVVRRRPATVVDQVPGIMAFQALAARTGTTVTDERQRLVVRTALDGEDVGADLSDPDVTVVLYKGGRRLPDLAKAAAAAGRLPGAVAGELLGMPGERIGALSDLAADGPASYLATVIVPAAAAADPEPHDGPARQPHDGPAREPHDGPAREPLHDKAPAGPSTTGPSTTRPSSTGPSTTGGRSS